MILPQRIRHYFKKINTIIFVLILLIHHSIIPELMIALKLHCVPNIPEFQHSIIPFVSEASQRVKAEVIERWDLKKRIFCNESFALVDIRMPKSYKAGGRHV